MNTCLEIILSSKKHVASLVFGTSCHVSLPTRTTSRGTEGIPIGCPMDRFDGGLDAGSFISAESLLRLKPALPNKHLPVNDKYIHLLSKHSNKLRNVNAVATRYAAENAYNRRKRDFSGRQSELLVLALFPYRLWKSRLCPRRV